jgi:putative protease
VSVALAEDAPEVRPGDWVVLQKDPPVEQAPAGGVFAVEAPTPGELRLKFGEPGPDPKSLQRGGVAWKSHDPQLLRDLKKRAATARRVPVDMVVRGALGEPLVVEAADALGRSARAASDDVLQPATGAAIDPTLLRQKLGELGNTPFVLRHLDAQVQGALALPPSQLKAVKRAVATALAEAALPEPRRVAKPVVWAAPAAAVAPGPVQLVALCRTPDQVEAALALGLPDIEIDLPWHDGLSPVLARCREQKARVWLATPVGEKVGEGLSAALLVHRPDGVLARQLGVLALADSALPVVADFALNVANAVTGRWLLDQGARWLTPARDLNAAQTLALAAALGATTLEVKVHGPIPLFVMQHCVFARALGRGQNRETCGEPCRRRALALLDRRGFAHPVRSSEGCRNTVFSGQPRADVAALAGLIATGVRRFRVELFDEDRATAGRVLQIYIEATSGRLGAAAALHALTTLYPQGLLP